MCTVKITDEVFHNLSHLIRFKRNDEAQVILRSIDAQDPRERGWRAWLLHTAAEEDNEVIIKVMLDMGFDVDAQAYHKNTAIAFAAMKRHYKTVSVILQFDPDLRYGHQHTPHHALTHMLDGENHPVNIANILKVLHADKNEKMALKSADITPEFIFGAVSLKNVQVMRSLLAIGGCPINDPFPLGISSHRRPLHEAFRLNSLPIAKLLLEHGADIEIRCEFGRIPVAYYYKFDDSDLELEIFTTIFRRLTTILTTCDKHNIMQITSVFNNAKKRVLKALLQSSVDLTAKDPWNSTPLHYLTGNLVMRNDRELIKMLGEKSIFYIVNSNSLLVQVVYYRAIAFLELFLDYGGNINTFNHKKFTPLQVLCRPRASRGKIKRTKHDYRCVELALQSGVDPQVELYFLKCERCRMLIGTQCSDCIYYDNKRYFENDSRTPVTDGRTVLDITLENGDYSLTKLILAHLALLEARGITITDLVQTRIDLHSWLSNYFNLCQLHLKRFQNTQVSECITLFELMCASEVRLELCLRNQFFLDHLKRIDKTFISKSIYSNIFWDKLRKPLRVAKAKLNAAAVIGEVMGLCYQAHYMIIDKIIEYIWSRETLRIFSRFE